MKVQNHIFVAHIFLVFFYYVYFFLKILKCGGMKKIWKHGRMEELNYEICEII